jgi:hypothetical protein
MWHRVEVVLTDVSEKRIASIFSVEGKNKKIRMRSVSKRRHSIILCKESVIKMYEKTEMKHKMYKEQIHENYYNKKGANRRLSNL